MTAHHPSACPDKSGPILSSGARPEPTQAQAVPDDEDGGQGHGGRGHQRVGQAERGQRDGQHVVAEGPGQVGADGPERGPGQRDRVGDGAQVVAQQDHVGGDDRDVRARTQGQSQAGGREGRAVVYPIPDHSDRTALVLQLADDPCLGRGERLADDLVDADGRSDGLGGGRVVAGQQRRTQAEGAQPGDRGGGRRLDRVGDGEGAADLAVPGGQDGGAAVFLAGAAPGGQVGRDGDVPAGEQPRAADDDLAAVYYAAGTEAGEGLEAVGFGEPAS